MSTKEMTKADETVLAHTPAPAMVPQTQESQMVNMIERLALNPDVDVDKLERMVGLQITMLDRQAEQEYTKAMVRVQQNLRGVKRDKYNEQTKSSYPSLEAMKKAVVPAYTAEGFAVSYGEGDSKSEDMIRVTCRVMHSGGHSEAFFYDCPIDDKGIAGKTNKTQTHGKASAVSYAERYILKLIFNVTIQDEDDDGNMAGQEPVETISEEQLATLRDMLEANGKDEGKFVAYLKKAKAQINALDDLPAGQWYDFAVKTLGGEVAR